ncbi:MAG: hypothetical protein DRJ09_13370 [Bacteroidetes bacterium]|nr:MAG: hypothetical protein DRJ09_13370 [Bacteroidota bacterium]
MQIWDGDRWYYVNNDSTTFYSNGGTLIYQYYWDEINNNWYYGVRYNDEFNEMGFRKLITKEWWHNGKWDTLWGDRYTYEYLNIDFWKIMNYELYDTADNKWNPAYKHVFSEFTYYVLNIPEVKKKEGSAGLLIIPNPSKNMLLIKLKDQAGSINAIKIYDITGREVLKRKGGINVKQKQLDISFLKSGTYIISVQTEKRQVLSGKFIKL